MNTKHYEDILSRQGIRPTANRTMIFSILAESLRPMSMSEIETELDSIDKSNISRALGIFKEKHLVHVIEDGSDNVKYELCHSEMGEQDEDLHAHFYCESCKKTICMENIPVPDVELPQGYDMYSANFVIKGICLDCKSNN